MTFWELYFVSARAMAVATGAINQNCAMRHHAFNWAFETDQKTHEPNHMYTRCIVCAILGQIPFDGFVANTHTHTNKIIWKGSSTWENCSLLSSIYVQHICKEVLIKWKHDSGECKSMIELEKNSAASWWHTCSWVMSCLSCSLKQIAKLC